MVYILSSGGFSSVIREVCDRFEVTYLFPCKGFGCHCDVVGKELPNCSCDHSSEELTTCCSDEQPQFSLVEEEFCCSEPEIKQSSQSLLSKSSCGGFEEEESFQVLKHLKLSEETRKESLHILLLINTPSEKHFLSKEIAQEVHKVPIRILS